MGSGISRPKFLYLSGLIGRKLRCPESDRHFILADIVAAPAEVYPRCMGIIVRRPFSTARAFVPLSDIARNNGNFKIIREPSEFHDEIKIEGDMFLLGATFLDKQIVDMSGSKVVRVNDLHLLSENAAIWLVHFDIGFSGILRRMGWLSAVNAISGWLFHLECRDRLLSWKYVQPLPSASGVGVISLKVNQRKLSEMHPADLAEILTDLSVDDRSGILESLDEETAARTLQEVPLKFRAPLIESMSREKAAAIIGKMHADEAADLIPELGGSAARGILALLPPEQAADIREILVHSSASAGGIMNTKCLTGGGSMTAGGILSVLRDNPDEWETISYVYVIDGEEHLLGVISIRELVSADPGARLDDIMKTKVISVEPETSVGRVATILFKYNFEAIPVIEEGTLVGIVTMRDAFGAAFPDIREDVEELS